MTEGFYVSDSASYGIVTENEAQTHPPTPQSERLKPLCQLPYNK